MSDNLYDFSAIQKHETDKALLLDCGEKEAIWFPKNLIENNGDGTYTIPEWLAIDKEIV